MPRPLSPGRLLALATRGDVGIGVPGATPLVQIPAPHELAFAPLIPQPIAMPSGIADPTRPREAMAPVMPRGQTRGSTQIVTVTGGPVTLAPMIDIADTEDRAQCLTIVASIIPQVIAAGDAQGQNILTIDWGASGGLHHAEVDISRGVMVRVHASALRVGGEITGVGTYVVRASVGAYDGGHAPATRSAVVPHVAAGTITAPIPAFASRLRAISNANLAYTLQFITRAGVVTGLVAVPAGAGEMAPIAVPPSSEFVQSTSAVAQRVFLIFELTL